MTDEIAAYKLAGEPFPGYFGIFYNVNRADQERERSQNHRRRAAKKTKGLKDWQILQKNFDRLK